MSTFLLKDLTAVIKSLKGYLGRKRRQVSSKFCLSKSTNNNWGPPLKDLEVDWIKSKTASVTVSVNKIKGRKNTTKNGNRYHRPYNTYNHYSVYVPGWPVTTRSRYITESPCKHTRSANAIGRYLQLFFSWSGSHRFILLRAPIGIPPGLGHLNINGVFYSFSSATMR